MKKFLTLAAILLLSGWGAASVFAQSGYQVKGVVVDAIGPVIGATILEEGTTNGISTGIDGDYILKVSSADATVVFSCVGYTTVSFKASQVPATVVLQEDSNFLDEAVVIGYGTVKKNDMTGSVTAIKTEEINRGAIVSTQDMLKGKVAGLQIIPGDGRPGGGSTIRIRGAASLNATNDPLIVIDGVPIAVNGGEGMTNPLEAINSNDIESFTVLKDASSAAIYGSRASNGVIIITTKKGVTGTEEPKISYNGSFSISHNVNKLDLMSPSEYKAFVAKTYPVGTDTGDAFAAHLGNANTDWYKQIFQTAFTQEHNASIYGSKGNFPYRISMGYLDQDGTLKTSSYKKGTLDVSLSPKFFDDHLSVNLNAKGVMSREEKADAGAVGTAAFFNPTLDPYFRNADGSIDYTTTNGFFNYGNGRGIYFTPDNLAAANPLDMLYSNRDNANALRFIGNAQFDYKLHGFEDLRFNLNLGMDVSRTKGIVGANPGSFNSYKDTENPRIGQYTEWQHLRNNTVLEFYANYNHEFGKHHLDAMAGYSWQHFYGKDRNISFFNETNEMKLNEGETPIERYPYWRTENYLVSFYGRLNYSYDSRYLLTFTLRDDGSSRFSPDTRWGLFPSAAAAWNIKQEHFLKDSRVLSALKLRASWGKTGQQEIGSNYPYLASYYLSTDVYHRYNMGGGYSFVLSPGAYDPDIKWETTTTYNAGIDLGFVQDRVTASVDVYRRDTDDLLNSVLTPMGANFGNTLLTNIGSMRNQGIEFAVNVVPIETKDMSLSLGVNGTFQNIEFTKLNNTEDPAYAIEVSGISGGTGNTIARHMVGYAPFTFYPYQQAYDHNGTPIQNGFIDRDGDGIITTADRYMSDKSPNPDFFYGVNLKFSYKNWDFGFNGHGSVGNWVFNNVRGENSSANFVAANVSVNNYLNYVKETGFRGTNSIEQYTTDLFLEDASFFRMDDINLGYTFPELKCWPGASLRLAFSVQNVFVITKYSGLDPEIPSENGVDSSIWPRPRTYSLRVNLNF